MQFEALREELKNFYWQGDRKRSADFAAHCFSILNSRVRDGMTVRQQKLLQYEVITAEFQPVLFGNTPFFFETGALSSLSDGARYAKGLGHLQAGGWVYARNEHKFWEQDRTLTRLRTAQGEELLYLICGPFNDDCQHFNFNFRPILQGGLRGIYERCRSALSETSDPDAREYLETVARSMLFLKEMAEKFARKAAELLETESDSVRIRNLQRIRDTAARVPWNKPETFYEALAVLAFLRKAIGTLEGVGLNSFGRLDLDLEPFYRHDLETGSGTPEEADRLIRQFLIIWDTHYDHNMEMAGYADHELENTYTLGGCDRDGNPFYNELTRMFLRATREEKIIFPKITCRFSKNSPKAYLDEINVSILGGTSVILFQNDDSTIPALVRGGRTLAEARDYTVTGCWQVCCNPEKHDNGNYVNLLKPFEYAVHNRQDKMEKVGIAFLLFDECRSFEDVYGAVLENCRRLLEERLRITRQGGNILHQVDCFPVFSSTLEGCLENRKDYAERGAKYNDDHLLLVGFPNIVDSLLAIKELVFDSEKYTLSELLSAVRKDWDGFETMRTEAVRCPGWGDGSEASCMLASRFSRDLYRIAESLSGSYGGRVHLGHLTYTEIRWWGEQTLATPDGRKSGTFFAQGLTPSRLKKIPFVTDVINSMAALDPTEIGASSVINVILPANKMDLALLESFLRACACSALQALQLNCTTRETLLDAMAHPEDHADLIIRVTGFSAKFTALSRGWQEEILSRNFYQ